MKRILWALSGIISIALISLCASGSVFAEPALPTESGVKKPDSAIMYTSGSYNGGSSPHSCTYSIGDYLVCDANFTSVAGSGTYFISGLDIHFPTSFNANTYATFMLQLHIGDYPSQWQFNGFIADENEYTHGVIVDQQVVSSSGGELIVQITLFIQSHTNQFYLRSRNAQGIAIVTNTGLVNKVEYNIGAVSWVRVLSGTDLQSSLNGIGGSILGTNDRLQQIINNGITANVDNSDVVNKLDQQAQQQHQDAENQLNATNAQTDAINQQTEQQQNQYDQEKQEEQDRENQANSAADEAAGIFNFHLANPFESIFSLFKSPNSCANIPILAGFVHAESSVYCAWFPASVRNVMTPAFGIFSIMLLFGFVMRWLGGSETIHFGGD